MAAVAELLGAAPPNDPRHAHSWLFDFNVYPYASVYLDPSGMLNAPWTDFTAGVLRSLGLELVAGAKLAAPDHIAALLEALATLLERQEDGDVLDSARARHGQQALLFEQILPWFPCFAAAIRRTAPEGLYACLSEVTLEALLEHAQLFEGVPPPFAFPEAEPTALEIPLVGKRKNEEVRRALRALMTPAQSGLFLGRADILRLGKQLGVPTRYAERVFMLEQLLSAAAEQERLAEGLKALADEARQQARGYLRLQETYPTLSALWDAWLEKLRGSELELTTLAASMAVETA